MEGENNGRRNERGWISWMLYNIAAMLFYDEEGNREGFWKLRVTGIMESGQESSSSPLGIHLYLIII